MTGVLALAQGLWSGWAVFLAMGSLGIIEFAVGPSATISNYCTVHGYPKQQDYFWYFGTCVAGVVGVLVHRWWTDVRMRRGWFHHLPLGRLRGLIFSATGTALLFKPQAISSVLGMIWL